MKRIVLVLAASVFVILSAPANAVPAARPTVISFTFDGTYKSQEVAAKILSNNGMAGTFYINAGYIGFPAHLSIDELRSIARNRNEIGGASLYGNDLSKLPAAQAHQEVCDDRTTLAQLGFQATSFAYPHGVGTTGATSAAQDCGYNSARDLAGLYGSRRDCSRCPTQESLPPADSFHIRTGVPQTTLALLKRQVIRAEAAGGGWVPMTFTRICECQPRVGWTPITPEDFTTFVRWLKARPSSTMVKTVDQVIGGPLKPVHGTAISRLVPNSSPAISPPPQALSKIPAWTLLGIGIGQSQVLLGGVVLSITIVITFRLASRGNRYAD